MTHHLSERGSCSRDSLDYNLEIKLSYFYGRPTFIKKMLVIYSQWNIFISILDWRREARSWLAGPGKWNHIKKRTVGSLPRPQGVTGLGVPTQLSSQQPRRAPPRGQSTGVNWAGLMVFCLILVCFGKRRMSNISSYLSLIVNISLQVLFWPIRVWWNSKFSVRYLLCPASPRPGPSSTLNILMTEAP